MQDIGYFKTLSYLVSLNNDNDSILANSLLNDMFSYYVNKLTIKQKQNLIDLSIDLLSSDSNKELINDLDSFKHYECNKKSLLEVLHILRINL